jgi:hypothetical protein
VGDIHPVQRTVEIEDVRVNPGFASLRRRFGAESDNASKRSIDPDVERVAPDSLAEASRYVKAVEGKNAALVRIDKKKTRIVARIGHGEYAAAIAVEKLGRSEKARHAHIVDRGADGGKPPACSIRSYRFMPRNFSSQ